MCRIYGLLGKHKITEKILSTVVQSQLNGGPDAQSYINNSQWILGNNRLKIQGLDGGIQPFQLGHTYAVYNGEIYNHHELRSFLKHKGYSFNDSCDGSIILPLYELYGNNFVKYLDGMFAIAIIDVSKESIIIANDPVAIKSIYYYWDQRQDIFYFSSELKSLLAFNIPVNCRIEAIDEYLIGRSIWHNKTFFSNINSLSPSTLLIKKKNQVPQFFKYDSNIKAVWNGQTNFVESAILLNDILETEMMQMTKADVPICAVTSGGLDSSYISTLSAKYIENLTCFNIAYEGQWPADERHFARDVAAKIGAKYHQILIKETDFPNILDKTIQHLGQPNSAPHALSTFALFQAIQDLGFKVALTGDGADEFFSGYERFRNAALNPNSNWLETYFDKMCATTKEMRHLVYHSNYRNFLTENQYDLLAVAAIKIYRDEKKYKSRLKALLNFDQKERFPAYILKRVDHLSMANSVEVRLPFCQSRIATFAKSLPEHYLFNNHSVKSILYESAKDLLSKSILARPKQPFTLPIQAMLRKGHVLFDILQATLTSHKFISRGFFNIKNINDLIKKQISTPTEDVSNVLWSLMILELWLQQLNSDISFRNYSINCIMTY